MCGICLISQFVDSMGLFRLCCNRNKNTYIHAALFHMGKQAAVCAITIWCFMCSICKFLYCSRCNYIRKCMCMKIYNHNRYPTNKRNRLIKNSALTATILLILNFSSFVKFLCFFAKFCSSFECNIDVFTEVFFTKLLDEACLLHNVSRLLIYMR